MDEDDKVAQAKRPIGDSDEEEDMPDYSVLSALSKRLLNAGLQADTPTPSIPKRGEKDFEPTGFGGQAKVLEQSREALFSTVSLPRLHSRYVPMSAHGKQVTVDGYLGSRVPEGHCTYPARPVLCQRWGFREAYKGRSIYDKS